MMDIVWAFTGAAAQIAFGYSLLGGFLEAKWDTHRVVWLLLGLWLTTAVYGFFNVAGIYGYLMYLLAMVMLLLCVFGESGVKGLCLLIFAVAVPVIVDLMARSVHDSSLSVGLGRLLLFLCAWLLWHFRRRSPGLREDTEALLLRQHMQMQQESMVALEQNYRLQRKNTHEFEHHMQVLRDLLARGEPDAAREYLDRLKKNRSIHAMNVSSRHPVVDVILNQKYQTAGENGIKMHIRVNDLSAVTVPTDSLVVVLTNLLDNAIEACRRIDDHRQIRCSIYYDDGLYISIQNTSLPVQIVDGKIPTSKVDPLQHGFGLLSVCHTLDGLDAEYTFGYEEGIFSFAAEVPPDTPRND